ncbi:MAG: helix-turn-helix domain-containing protein [Saprospiraceae bacterium]|nr:helix-turn-helix domain-containing protein [Saprospiraceae bacterium]
MVDLYDIRDVRLASPCRVKKYLLIWCSKGKIEMVVDHKELSIHKNEVLTITSGQYHAFMEVAGASGYVLEFTYDFMCKSDSDIELIFQNSLFCHFDYNEVIAIPEAHPIEHHLAVISEEIKTEPFQYLTSVHARIGLVLVEINRAKLAAGGEVWKPDALFLKFLEFIRHHFEQNYSLSEIARQLHTTTARLNDLAKLHTGKTAQNVLYGLIISEAKRIIQYENFMLKEIAFQLGFNDPFYFSRFFKTHAGMSPSAYQESVKSIQF